jgi:hypothetical protein
MKTTTITLLGCLLTWMLSTAAFAQTRPPIIPPPPRDKLSLEQRVGQLEKMTQTLQDRVEALEDFVHLSDPGSKFDENDGVRSTTPPITLEELWACIQLLNGKATPSLPCPLK